MRKVGCLGLILLFGLLMAELWLYLELSERIDDYLIPILAIIVAMVVGAKVLHSAIRMLPTVVLSGGAGRVVMRAVGGGLLLFPGLGTDVIGLLLVLPGTNHLFGRMGDKILASVVKRSMGRMLGGAAGGMRMPPGFPGAFPGMKPDDRARFGGGPKSGPKTYDAKPEKD